MRGGHGVPPLQLFRGCFSLCLFGVNLPSIAFPDTRGFSAQATKVVELGAPYPSLLHHINVIDDGRVQREDSLHANAEAGFSHRYRFAGPAVFAGYHHAFECLQALLGF
jgi:hypothetical protein